MDTALLIILIVIGNLSLYWLLWGKKQFEDKYKPKEENEHDSLASSKSS